jgi:isopenicillin-N epimerase
MLRPDLCFLNHGSFGAVTRRVFDEQTKWRLRIEADPIEMIGRQMSDLLAQARIPIGKQFGMQPNDFGMVTNATDGINAVLRSLTLKPGDELLTTDHVYGAVRRAMQLVARQAGAAYREVAIPLPIRSADLVRDIVLNAVSSNTKLLVIDHVTSPTALVFPVKEIIDGCREKGVEVLVDGAHVPGMLPLNVEQVGATYYAANLHKWMCAPKGTAFIWVAPHRQADIHPTTISHHLDDGFSKEFAWQGTRDFSGWLTAPTAIDFMNELGFDKVMAHNHQLAAWAQQLLTKRWGTSPISPVDGSLLGSMATVPLPSPFDQLEGDDVVAFHARLYKEFQIENPIVRWGGQTMLRVSCQVYNQPHEYEHVAATIQSLR